MRFFEITSTDWFLQNNITYNILTSDKLSSWMRKFYYIGPLKHLLNCVKWTLWLIPIIYYISNMHLASLSYTKKLQKSDWCSIITCLFDFNNLLSLLFSLSVSLLSLSLLCTLSVCLNWEVTWVMTQTYTTKKVVKCSIIHIYITF